MADNMDQNERGKLSFDIELKDILQVVSQAGRQNFIGPDSREEIEAEEIRKAWFKHMLLSIEKLHDSIEDLRRVEIASLKLDFQRYLDKLEQRVERVENQVKSELDKLEKEIKNDIDKIAVNLKEHKADYKEDKRDVIGPMKISLTQLQVKMGFIGILSGMIGSGIMTFVLYLINEYLIKTGG